jgi:hypothetical protein
MAKTNPLDYDDAVGKSDVLFEVRTPMGFTVSVKVGHWETIVSIKHPVMAGRDSEVRKTLEGPEQVRRSRRDPKVYLFYREERAGRWICAVVKRLNGEAFLITAYPTDAIKEGEPIWKS